VRRDQRRYMIFSLFDEIFTTFGSIILNIINSLPEITLHYKEPPYKCHVEPNNKYSELNKFLPLNDTDKSHLYRALDYLSGSQADLLKAKIEGLYDFLTTRAASTSASGY